MNKFIQQSSSNLGGENSCRNRGFSNGIFTDVWHPTFTTRFDFVWQAIVLAHVSILSDPKDLKRGFALRCGLTFTELKVRFFSTRKF